MLTKSKYDTEENSMFKNLYQLDMLGKKYSDHDIVTCTKGLLGSAVYFATFLLYKILIISILKSLCPIHVSNFGTDASSQ